MVIEGSVESNGLAHVNDYARRVVVNVVEDDDGVHAPAIGSIGVRAAVQIGRGARVLSERAGGKSEEYDNGTEHLRNKAKVSTFIR